MLTGGKCSKCCTHRFEGIWALLPSVPVLGRWAGEGAFAPSSPGLPPLSFEGPRNPRSTTFWQDAAWQTRRF